ncbi:MAG: hypothetical protein KGD68_10020, partial [Candidatus Lokiarchaeota archaeon]|nr:hypothetical protein [Candidatus Lokiarchaeota archaeon]
LYFPQVFFVIQNNKFTSQLSSNSNMHVEIRKIVEYIINYLSNFYEYINIEKTDVTDKLFLLSRNIISFIQEADFRI